MMTKDSNTKYHSSPGYSSTRIKDAKKSMLHYKKALGLKLDNENLTFGSLVHCIYLEPETLHEEFIIYNEGERPNKKAGMTAKANEEWLQEMKNKADLAGLQGVVSTEQIKKAVDMREIAFEHPYIYALFNHPEKQPEVSFYQEMEFQNLKTGKMEKRNVKARPDLKIDDMKFIIDIKTTGEGGAEKNKFTRTIEYYNYDLSAAFYKDIMSIEDSKYHDYNFIWFVQEKTEPYHYNLIYASPEHLINGRKDYQRICSNIVTCEYLNFYPSYFGFDQIEGAFIQPPGYRKSADFLNVETIDIYRELRKNKAK